MGLLDKIAVRLADELAKREPNRGKKRVSKQLKRNYQYRIELDLTTFKEAVDSARLPDTFWRKELYIIYEQAVKDSHLASQIRTAFYAVTQSDYEINRKGKVDEAAIELLQTKWFDDFVRYAVDAEFWGHSLIEFGQLNNEGRFDEVQLIPRLNVRQELGIVVPEYEYDKGVEYRNNATRLALIEVGDPYDLGLLELAAKEVITKNYARTDWSLSSEKYGMPLLSIRTDTTDKDELDKMEDQAANFAANGYVITSKEDEVEIVQPKNSDFYQIYQENIGLCDAQISKIINGQTGTSDEKAFVGSAEVHERILNDYTRARLRKVQHIVNNKLIPFLIAWGYPLSTEHRFSYPELIRKPAANKDDMQDDKEKQEKDDEKKKAKLSLPDWVFDMPMEAHSH